MLDLKFVGRYLLNQLKLVGLNVGNNVGDVS